MRTARLFQVGLVMAVSALALPFAADRWLATRVFQPVDEPVSLALGAHHTSEFKINLSGEYVVYVAPDSGGGYTPYISGCNSTLETKWSVTQSGRLMSPVWVNGPGNGRSTGTFLGDFSAEPGLYRLDLEVVSNSGCFDACHPRLTVITAYSSAYEWYQAICAISFLLGFGGIAVLARPAVGLLGGWRMGGEALEGVETYDPDRLPALPLPWHKPTSLSAIRWIPHFALFAAFGLAGLVCVMMVLTAISGPPTPRGHWIHTRPIYSPSYQPTNVLIVRVEDNHQEIPNCVVNEVQVKCPDVLSSVNRELVRRNDWVVYVDGNSSLEFEQVARIIGQIQKSGAKVVLLTPKLKREFLGKKPTR